MSWFTSYIAKVEAIDESGNVGSVTQTFGTMCFLAGTQVLTENGMKNIEDIKVGDEVYSINTDTNQRELKIVTNVFKGKSDETYELTIGDEVVKTTPKHQFYIVDKGWVRAYELVEGDQIVAKDDNSMVITKIEHKFHEEPVEVYNLTVDGYHNYLITKYEMLVHNAASPVAPTPGIDVVELIGAYYDDGSECDVEIVGEDNAKILSEEGQAIYAEARENLGYIQADYGVPESIFFYVNFVEFGVKDIGEICDVVLKLEGNPTDIVVVQYIDGEFKELETVINNDNTITIRTSISGPVAILVN